MPGDPFKKPYKGGNTRAAPGRPSKVTGRKTFVPKPSSPNGNRAKSVRAPATPAVKVTTKARKSVSMPRVRQGAQMGTPGKTGSRAGAPWE